MFAQVQRLLAIWGDMRRTVKLIKLTLQENTFIVAILKTAVYSKLRLFCQMLFFMSEEKLEILLNSETQGSGLIYILRVRATVC